MKKGVDLRPLLGEHGRIALALVDSVPAGKYAKAALTSLDMWDNLAPRTAQVENVRAALLLVARGETPLGVVYGSDALAEPRVKVLATFPESSHPPIVYPVAKVKASAHPQAAAFVHWLRTPAAAAIFRDHGFRKARSEEHTSELQSLMRISYAVFCLNKKKNKRSDKHTVLITQNL